MVNTSSRAADTGATHETPIATVTGDAVVRAEPDEAVLWISLTALRDAPGPALSDVSTRRHALAVLVLG